MGVSETKVNGGATELVWNTRDVYTGGRALKSQGQGWSGSQTGRPGQAPDWSGLHIVHFLPKNGIWSGKNHTSAGFGPKFGPGSSSDLPPYYRGSWGRGLKEGAQPAPIVVILTRLGDNSIARCRK